jgi:nucleoporin NUP159
LAAASPDRLVVASTESVRKAFTDPTSGGNIKSFTPALSIPVPRLSHVAFTSDGSCLVLAAEQGGGLAVHSVENLLKNITNPVIELRTNGVAIQALVPNPAPESAHLIAVVLADGQLLVANLQDRSFANGVNGVPAFQDGVRSVAWSVRGRQLIAGRLDGTAVQLDISGAPKAVVPRPPGVESDKEGLSVVSFIFKNANYVKCQQFSGLETTSF